MENKSTIGQKIAAGAGLAAAAAAAAGAYFLYGTKEGEKQRKKIHGWTLKMKGEVLEKIEQMKDVSEEKYQEIIDNVSKKYEGLKHIDAADVQAIAKELKGHWRSINRRIDGGAKKKRPAKKKSASQG